MLVWRPEGDWDPIWARFGLSVTLELAEEPLEGA